MQPDAPLTLDEQRRLCVTARHLECTAYTSARHRRVGRLDEDGIAVATVERARFVPARPTVPVTLDPPARRLPRPRLAGRRTIAVATTALTAVTAVVLAFGSGLLAGPPPGPGASQLAVASPSAAATERTPSAPPSPAATVPPSAPAVATRTYRIRRGDSLGRIARRFGTTVAVLKELNDIPEPPRIRIGQVLEIP